MAEIAVSIKHLYRYEKIAKRFVVDDFSWDIPAGILASLIGADGAGKTTVLQMVAGILQPNSGSVSFFGESRQSLQGSISYMPQKFGLYEDLTVDENLKLFSELYGLTTKVFQTRREELLNITGLENFTTRLSGNLSGGMKQKLGLACTLLSFPKILLLDEASVGVDPLSRKDLLTILRRRVEEQKMTVLSTTTYLDEASFSDVVCIIEQGKAVQKGVPKEIAKQAKGLTYLASLPNQSIRSLQVSLMDAKEWVLDATPQAEDVKVLLKDPKSVRAVKKKWPDLVLSPREPTLEDAYLFSRYKLNPQDQPVLDETFKRALQPKNKQQSLFREGFVVKAQDLVKKFGNFTAVDHTSFEIKAGEIFGLLGPNGAGKTTTFKMLCGLLSVSSGSLIVADCDVVHNRNKARENIGYMAQKFSLYEDLSCRENMEFFGGAYFLSREKIQKRIQELASAFDLQEWLDRKSKDLPGGLKQRLSMAVAIEHEPAVLFLDEPTSGADIPARRFFWRIISELANQGATVIVTTHFMEEALYCDRLMIQDQGRCLIMGSPKEVLKNHKNMDEAFIALVEHGRNS